MMEQAANPSATVLIIGAVAAVAGAVFSKLAENWGADRRADAEERRKDDRDVRADRERLRDENAQLRSAIQVICIAHSLPFPPIAERGIAHYREES